MKEKQLAGYQENMLKDLLEDMAELRAGCIV